MKYQKKSRVKKLINNMMCTILIEARATSVRKNSARFCKCVQNQPPELFFKKSVLKNFAKFIEKHLGWSLLLNKVESM